MFGRSIEKQVARRADKVVSMKEDVEALSWSRVMEIGQLLQRDDIDESARKDLAEELVSIAHSNISLYVRLGIEPDEEVVGVMSSGIEMLKGGLAQAAKETPRLDPVFDFDPDEGPVECLKQEPSAPQESRVPQEPSAPQEFPAEQSAPSDNGQATGRRQRFARFSHVYESRDGGLCVFEDEHGHLMAVDASKLA